jgi:protoporphyrinogen oxidase
MSDAEIVSMALEELKAINFVDSQVKNLDHRVIKVPKAYPAYYGTYSEFDVIRNFTDSFENLFLIGRNGMHHYNNQDHSMLTAIQAVKNIISNNPSKENIWEVNTEEDYHESK